MTPPPEEAAAIVAGLTPQEHLAELEALIYAAVPLIDPPGCHWLNSNASASYCWPCAREAAWRELPTIGPAPTETDWWRRDPQEELIRDRIDGPSSGESDSCEACETCGCTLSYLLTDYGQEEELAHFLDWQLTSADQITGTITYELSRAFMDLSWSDHRPELTRQAVEIAEAVRALLSQPDRAGEDGA